MRGGAIWTPKIIGRDHDRCYHRGRPLGLFGKRLGEELDCCFCRRDAFCHRQYHIQGWQ